MKIEAKDVVIGVLDEIYEVTVSGLPDQQTELVVAADLQQAVQIVAAHVLRNATKVSLVARGEHLDPPCYRELLRIERPEAPPVEVEFVSEQVSALDVRRAGS